MKRMPLRLSGISFLLVACLSTHALAQSVTSAALAAPDTTVAEVTQGQDRTGRSIDEVPVLTVDEARARAMILHETLHGSLQVMHRDFFREDEGLSIPSRSLEDVFAELERTYGLELRWIAVDLKAMNIDNEPESRFEKEAVGVLRSGKKTHESADDDMYRFAGKIRLSATCLSCHASRRSNNDDRAAGLVISIPLNRSARGHVPAVTPAGGVLNER
ncbi:c-type heme family protein [Rhodopirellula sp. P2]|uniref:c-type heme family protein n=1 Tax=Rhodopirellula sp. P2 TaxID=2127060 RepID=UPI002367598B|nr:DUF3365 domain-containing protein [Rhodopirellula sp. P2]WDQ15206.1 DUF3365 domain-containing protein [Rhodopirellula sp. P2]